MNPQVPFESEPLREPSLRHADICTRILRREPALTQFETAQIANLCPVTAEEAKSCIPRCAMIRHIFCWFSRSSSLVKLDDDRLQALLDEIQTMRKFQN